jgi:hypothetical protein
VTYRLIFGRFLEFITRVINAAPPADLTEGYFRVKLWKGTRGSPD